jgi:molybdopterin-containing oxidoreductase family iron-sulfur binding subunit
MSLTGANADYRLRLRPDEQLSFVAALINEIAVGRKKGTLRGALPAFVTSTSLEGFASKHALSREVLNHLVDDLIENAGRSMVVAGNILSAETHVAVNYLNELLGNSAVYGDAASVIFTPYSTPEEFQSLVDGMKSGRIGMVGVWL